MNDRSQAVDYLSGDVPLHIDMLEAIRREAADLAGTSSRGVLLWHREAGAWMLSAADTAAATALIRLAGSADLFVCHQADQIPLVRQRFGLTDGMYCHQAAWLTGGLLPEPAVAGLAISRLDESCLPFVRQHYSHAIGESYLRERLCAGMLYGASIDGRPAGFAGFHPEGSLGMLEVLPAFRRRGVALALQAFLANINIRQGQVPFAQIKIGNMASLALQRKAGFTLADGTISWLMKGEIA